MFLIGSIVGVEVVAVAMAAAEVAIVSAKK